MSLYSRAQILYDRRRFEDAAAALHQHLAQEPNDADAHALLALVHLEVPGQRKQALASINDAIGLEADFGYHHAVKAMVLGKLDQDQKALACAEEAIRLEPDLVLGWIMKGQALGGLSRWKDAEAAARHALALDPDSEDAQNTLAIYLRMQGRVDEASDGADRRLQRAPEDPIAHANSGWAALHNGQRKEAEEHFREALRLKPNLEYARDGLRESYKARSPVYRLFLKWVFFMQRFTEGQRWLIIIGIYVAFRFGRAILAQVHPVAASALVILYLTFCCWSFLASGTAHALMLVDRSARLTLNFRERLDAIFVGLSFFAGVILLILGTTLLPVGIAFLGAALAIAAVPCSNIFLNNSRAGHLVFGGIALLIYIAGIAALVVGMTGTDPFEHPLAGPLAGMALIGGMLTTWISNIPALNSHAER